MDVSEALQLIEQNVKNDKLVKHMIAVSAIMKEVAKFLGEDERKWELTGLLHDIDYEIVKGSSHGTKVEEILRGKVDEEILRAIKSHTFEFTKVMPRTKMEHALIAADNVSGLIIATALVMPSKKLEEVRVKSVINSFKDKSFARRCSREKILYCEKIGMKRDEFFEISLNALKNISDRLEL